MASTAGTRAIAPALFLNPALALIDFSEIPEPQKVIPHLLQPEISRLAPDILAIYIQAVSKIFGSWAAELAQRWDDDDLPQVKASVDTIIARINEFATSPHIEVQERVRCHL